MKLIRRGLVICVDASLSQSALEEAALSAMARGGSSRVYVLPSASSSTPYHSLTGPRTAYLTHQY